jgi:gluconokinase
MTSKPHNVDRVAGPPAASVIVIVMGVAGSGKTTIGRLLASRLGWRYWDADQFHDAGNREKMRAGIPLTDDDRCPWLQRLRREVIDAVPAGESAVLACSSLKASYRHLLSDGADRVRFVYLQATRDVIRARLRAREGHFMSPALADSQFAELEEPRDAIVVNAALEPSAILETILRALKVRPPG